MNLINELRRLAQEATPGPDGVSLNWLKLLQDFQKEANPAAISELLDRLEAAEKERDELRDRLALESQENGALRDSVERACEERDELRTELKEVRHEVAMTHYTINTLQAKIEEMEQQGPVASVWRCDNNHIHGSCERTLPMGAKLFALPGAKGE